MRRADQQGGEITGRAAALPRSENAPDPLSAYQSFEAVVALIRARRDVALLVDVEAGLHLVHYAPGRIEFAPARTAPADLAQRLSQRLAAWTGVRWTVSVVAEGGAPTIAEQRAARTAAEAEEAMTNPVVQAVLAAFPGARIEGIRAGLSPTAAGTAADDPEGAAGDEGAASDWDPFEED